MPSQERGHSPYPPQQHQQGGQNASYYGEAPPQQQGYASGPGGPEGERGLGSTLLGGAAGGFAGHKMGGGFMGSAGGAILGAVGANIASHAV
jgi:predicted lipid-binding transport protein (Tim44 family)